MAVTITAGGAGLTLSLVLNVVLIAVGVQRLSPSRDVSPSSVSSGIGRSEATPARSVANAETIGPAQWTDLLAGSMADVVKRLQAEGFPPKLQRVMLRAVVAQQFADRHRALADLIRARPWWKAVLDSTEGAKLISARQKLDRDEDDTVDALIGPDLGSTPYITASRFYRYGNLRPEMLSELDRINSDYGELTAEIRNASQGIMLPEDREKLLFLERQRHADIAQRLTPDQMFEYELRSSPESWWLRTISAGMNVTEDEFRALFKVRSAFIAPYSDGQYELMSAEDRQALARLEPELLEKVRGVLTPDRFAEYQLKTTPQYRETEALVKRLSLPADSAAVLVTVQNEITKRAEAVRSNATLTAFARDAQLNALADEAVARLTPTLGDAGLTAYQQSAGAWLNRLRPRPTPTNPKG